MKKIWSYHGDNVYTVSTDTSKQLPPALYSIRQHPIAGVMMIRQEIRDEKLVDPGYGYHHEVISEVEKFWTLKDKFTSLGIPYRRGILLYGPPGTGKTAIARMAIRSIINKGGIALDLTEELMTIVDLLPQFREIEKDRPIVGVIEDIDVYCGDSDYERAITHLLDGVGACGDNIIYIATTNDINAIPQRIKCRPSRFDLTLDIGLPELDARKAYLEKMSPAGTDKRLINEIAEKSEGLNISFLKEILTGHLLFEYPIDHIIDRLKYMNLTQEDIKLEDNES
jgi:SpoVK/Ycf46/Vps4 family AAA+-type ATPase